MNQTDIRRDIKNESTRKWYTKELWELYDRARDAGEYESAVMILKKIVDTQAII